MKRGWIIRQITRQALPILALLVCAASGSALEQAGSKQRNPSNDASNPSENFPTKQVSRAAAVQLRVRDVETEYSVPATVCYGPAEEHWSSPVSAQTDQFGRLRLEVTPGEYLFEITAPGYKPMRTHSLVRAGWTPLWTINLSPKALPKEEMPEILNPKLRRGYTLVHGYAVDAETGQPVPKVRVRLEKTHGKTETNERGYYALSVPSLPTTEAGGVPIPGTENLSAELPGYKKIVEENFVMPPGDVTGFNLLLERGTGLVVHDDTHKLMRSLEQLRDSQSINPGPDGSPLDPWILEWLSQHGEALRLGTGAPLQAVSPTALSLPSQITVGLNCPTQPCRADPTKQCPVCGSPCLSKQTFALEDYVQKGLDEE